MKPAHWMFIASLFGLAIPLLWSFAYLVVGRTLPTFGDWLFRLPHIDQILLLVWPTSFLLIGDPTDSNVGLWVVAALGNGLFYGMLGLLTWLGFHRSKLLLLAPVSLVAGTWLFLISL